MPATDPAIATYVEIASTVLAPLAYFVGTAEGAGYDGMSHFDMIREEGDWADTVSEYPMNSKIWTPFYKLKFDREFMIKGLIEYTVRCGRPLIPLDHTLGPLSVAETEAIPRSSAVRPETLFDMTDQALLALIHDNITFTDESGSYVNPELVLSLAPDLINFEDHSIKLSA